MRYLRIAPRKVRLVADLIRGKRAQDAQAILGFTTKAAASPIFKLLNSAMANAKNNFHLESSDLYVSKISVDEGPKFKRWRARARGQAAEIQKKTSHVNLILGEIKKTVGKIKEKPQVLRPEAKPEEVKIKPRTQKFRPEMEAAKPKSQKGIQKIFRRKVV